MSLTMTVNPGAVPQGEPSTAMLTVLNDDAAVVVTGIVIAVDACLVDKAGVQLTPYQKGWTVNPPVPDGTRLLFHAVAPAGTSLLMDGIVTFSFPVSVSATTGNVSAVVTVQSGAQQAIPPVSITVTTQLAFTSVNLDPAQVGSAQSSTLSWASAGQAQCVLEWTPRLALSVQSNGVTSKPGDGSMAVRASGQAVLTPTASAHMTLTATLAGQQRQEQVSLWLPSLALMIGSAAIHHVLDLQTALAINYWVENNPLDPTSITLAWSGSSAGVTQNGSPVANGGALAVPASGTPGTFTLEITASTVLILMATTPSGLSQTLTYPIKLGEMVGITLAANGWYDCRMVVAAEAEGHAWSLDTGTLLLNQSSTLWVPSDSSSVSVAVSYWNAGWNDWKHDAPPLAPMPAAISYATGGSLFSKSLTRTSPLPSKAI
jgi:hypothetical protein